MDELHKFVQHVSTLAVELHDCRIVDLSDDQDTTDLEKCIVCALHQIAADSARLDGASIFAVGACVTAFAQFTSPTNPHGIAPVRLCSLLCPQALLAVRGKQRYCRC